MTNYIRDNSKKFLAVLGVILMVAFILPTQSNFGDRSSRSLVGSIGDEKVYDADIRRAKQQWEFLEQVIVISPEAIGNQIVPVANFYRRNPAFNILAEQVANHPEVFYLLQVEADRQGIIVLPSDMDEEFKRRRFAVRLSNGVICSLEDVTDHQYADAIRDAAAALTRVERSMSRAMYASKVSRPLREHEIARQLQQVQLDVVDFSTNDLLSQVPAPTPDDLKTHFDAYADVLPDSPPTANNPHGFGYKYPNRVTLQYLGVRHEDVRQAVLATKSQYDWDVEAQKYYLRPENQARFRVPASQPATLPSALASTTRPAPATGPTTKPFADVRNEIVEALVAPEIARKSRDLQDRITARLRADYDAWHVKNPNPQSLPTTQSTATSPTATTTTAATTSAGANDFTSFEYIQQLAKEVEQQTGVRPVIASLNRYQTAKDLMTLEGIGQANLNQIPFPLYATEFAAEFVPASERERSQILHLYKPSQVLRDASGSSYVFRLTGASASGRPESMDEVADSVERDWKFARAYDSAKSQATKVLESARKSSLASAAAEANRRPIRTGVFDSTSQSIENLTLSPEALGKFRFEALGLLSTAATQPDSPMKLIELPQQGRVFVAELLSAKPRIDTSALGMMDAMVENELMNQLSEPIVKSWYEYTNVIGRTGYKDLTAERKKT